MSMHERDITAQVDHIEAEASERTVFVNLTRAELVEHTVTRGEGFQIERTNAEGRLEKGALAIETKRNARAAKDKHFVKTPQTEGKIWEEVNRPMSPEGFNALRSDVQAELDKTDMYVQYVALSAPDDPEDSYRTRQIFKFITDSPAHALFATNVYQDLTDEEREAIEHEALAPDVTVYHAKDFTTDPEKHNTRSDVAIAFDYEQGEIVIAGTDYLGEIKKSGFTWMHYMAKQQTTEDVTVAVIHGSLVQNEEGNAAVVTGNSGAGKSSALPNPTPEEQACGKMKVGDDETLVIHDRKKKKKKTVNIEGGVYISVHKLDTEVEKEFAEAIWSPTSLLENVKMHPGTKTPNFEDASRTPNMRAALNGESLPNYKASGVSGELSDYINLYADMRGIFPPVARMRNKYHAVAMSLIGFATNIPGRVDGENEIKEDFFAWCDQPFLPFPPVESIDNIMSIFEENETNVWVVSSGYQGGPHGEGVRLRIPETQAAVAGVVDGTLASEFEGMTEKELRATEDPVFGWQIPPSFSDANVWPDSEAKEFHIREFTMKFLQAFNEKYPIDSHPAMPLIYAELPKLSPATVFEAE